MRITFYYNVLIHYCQEGKPQKMNFFISESDFLAGDTVVFIDALKPDHLMTVHKVQGNGVLLDGNRNFALGHLVRHARVAELNAKRRMTAAELAVGEVS